MSNIPPPNLNNSNYGHPPYGGSTLRESRTGANLVSMGDDPWGNYGLDGSGDSSGGGQNTALQKYAYDRQLALTTLQNGNLDPQTRQVWQNYLKELDGWFQQYGSAAQMTGGTLGGDANGDIGGGTTNDNPQYGEMIWQDQTRIKWDGSDPVSVTVSTKGDKRQQDFFQDDVTINIPLHCRGKEKITDDDSVPGAKMLIVTISMPDGSQRVFVKHNLKDTSSVKILTPDGDASQFDVTEASDPLSSQVTIGKIGEDNPDNQLGDPPTKRKDGKLGWDGDSFDIYSADDGNKDKYVSARGTVNFHARSNTEYWSVDWNDKTKQYEVSVFDDPTDWSVKHQKGTFYVDDMTNLKMTFDIDPSHITFWPPLGKGSTGDDSHKINSSDPHGKKLSFAKGDGASDPANPNLPEPGSPDTKDGEHVVHNYKKNSDPIFTNYFDDPDATDNSKNDTVTYQITATGTVHLTAANQDDQFSVTKESNWFVVTAKGTDSNGQPKTVIYKIDATKVSKVEFDNINSGSVSIIKEDKTRSEPTFGAVSDTDLAKFITKDGKTIADAQQAQQAQQDPNDPSNLPANIQALLAPSMTGKSYSDFANALKKNFPAIFALADSNHDGTLTVQEFVNAVNNKVIVFPPAPSRELLQFLRDLDTGSGGFDQHLNNAFDHEHTWEIGNARDRLVDLLQVLYPDHAIGGKGAGDGDHQLGWNDIYIDGHGFSMTNETSDDSDGDGLTRDLVWNQFS